MCLTLLPTAAFAVTGPAEYNVTVHIIGGDGSGNMSFGYGENKEQTKTASHGETITLPAGETGVSIKPQSDASTTDYELAGLYFLTGSNNLTPNTAFADNTGFAEVLTNLVRTFTMPEESVELWAFFKPEKDANAAPYILTESLSSGVVNVAYSATVSAIGDTGFTWSAEGLPEGMSIDTSTGTITGTPTAEDSYSVTVTATGSNTAVAGSREFTLNVDATDTPPILTAGDVNRTGAREATVKFTSSEAGAYYYTVAGSDVIVPPVDTAGAGTPCGTAEQTITLTTLTNDSTQYVYIKVKDMAGNMSDTLKITIPAYVPTVGPFTVTGGTYSVDYVYEPESSDSDVMVLKVQTTTPLTIKNTDPDTPTQHRIKVTAPRAAITLAGVNIDRSSQASYASFEVATADAAAPVTIILANGSTNTLKSSHDSAGVQNGSSPIIITCEGADTPGHGCDGSCGRLEVPYNNNSSGAGIGGQGGAEGSNITISGGNITAAGVLGAGIGGGGNSSGSNITISGGIVTATSQHGSGIGGGGTTGGASNITISGGTVTATGSVDWTGIGGTGPNNVTDLWIRPKPGYQIEVREGLDLSQFPPSLTGEWNITSNLTGNTFSSVASLIPYSVTSYLTNLTSNGAATATYGTDYAATLTAASGYALPETVTVTVGGTELTVGTDYTWSGGVLTIPGTKVTGNIVITAEAVPVPVLTVIAPTFAEVAEGYAQPTAKAITITNNGNATVNIANVEANNTNFTIDGSGSSVAAGSSIDTWTVQPSANLGVGTHTATITVTYDGGKTATATVSFTVAAAAPNTYTVTFNSNGGTGTMAAQTFTHGVAQSLSANSFTRSDYTFTGWNTEENGGGTAYSDGQSVTLTTGGMILYAQWKKENVSTKTEVQSFDADDITDELRDKGYTTPEQIETVLKTQITQTGVPSGNTAFYDIVLLYSDDGGNTWIEADEEHFPNNGQLPISIPVPNGVNANTHDFYGIHMFSKTAFGKIAGDTENVVFTERTENGTVYLDGFVNGLSPILVGWKTTGGTDPDPAPSITGVTVSPSTATVNKGSTRQFTATVTGTGNYNTAVTWSISGNISRGTTISATGILTVDSAENASVLTVTATAVGDTTKSASVVVTVQYVEPAEGVKIISPTADQTITVVEGDTATMRITAENAIGYQWYIDRNDGNGFVAINGANDSSYTTSATTLTNDGYRYYCGAYNDISPANSPIFTLRVIAGHTVRVSASPTEGGSVTGAGAYTDGTSVTVTATAHDGYRFLRWTENGSEVGTNESYTFTITADRTLVAVFEEKEDDVDPIIPDPENPPVITSPTKDQTVNVYVGDKATMSVKATDADSYQWYVDRGNGFEAILGVTGASYTTSAASLENDGYRYYCVAINAYGTDTSPIFTLNVKKDAVIPVTGDSSQPGLWIVLMMIALAGLAICAVMWRRSRKYNHQ